jgi:hypothetical protein
MGPSTRGGERGRTAKKKRAAMYEGIENALSEAMTDPNDPTRQDYNRKSKPEKIMDSLKDRRDRFMGAIAGRRPGIRTFGEGGRPGDVRGNPNRGKTY